MIIIIVVISVARYLIGKVSTPRFTKSVKLRNITIILKKIKIITFLAAHINTPHTHQHPNPTTGKKINSHLRQKNKYRKKGRKKERQKEKEKIK